MSEIRQQLEPAFAAMPHSTLWVHPWLAVIDYSAGDGVPGLLHDRGLIEQAFADGDRMNIGHIGELAVLGGKLDLAGRAYQALLPWEEDCASAGLMGPTWIGPVAGFLGTLATALGKTGAAAAHLERALSKAEAMRCGPVTARIHQQLAGLAEQQGDLESAARHYGQADQLIARLGLRLPSRAVPDGPGSELVAGPDTTQPFSMQREGDVWRVVFNGDSALIKQSKGMALLATLIDKPETEVHVLDLVTPTGSARDRDTTDSGPLLDDQARKHYQQRIAELREELEEARGLGDIGRGDALQGELDFISSELSRAFGLGGRRRGAGAAAERARVNVQRRLRDAIKRIEVQLPAASRYLDNTVKTGTYCQYKPM